MSIKWENHQEWKVSLPAPGERQTIDCYAGDVFKGRLVSFQADADETGAWALDTELHLATGLPRISEWARLEDAKAAVEEALS